MLRGFFDFMAKMGLSVRDDPPKVIDLSIRTFGPAKGDMELSVLQLTRDDPDALVSVSVVLRNAGQEPKALTVPGWLGFYQFDVRHPDGSPVAKTPFGRALSHSSRKTERIDVSLAPGALHETEVPLGSIFSLRPHGHYAVRASSQLSDGTLLQSNEIVLT
jgi:hypothetical protein